LNSDQLDVRHGNEVAEVSGVKNRMPVADFDRDNTNNHVDFLIVRIFPRRSRQHKVNRGGCWSAFALASV
jgi:hypothetical protein